MSIRPVSIVGAGQIPVMKANPFSLREMGAAAVRQALADAGVSRVDALFVGNMLSEELQNQKHVAALIADQAELYGIEALEVKAATATGAAALRMAYLAVASGEAELAVALGVEKMSEGAATPAMAKALDAEKELPGGATLISRNADLLRMYIERYKMPANGLVNFAVNAHRNAHNNPNALFRHKRISSRDVMRSHMVIPPIRLLDCAPICDGASAVVLAPESEARAFTNQPVHILASSVATDRFRLDDRRDPLWLDAAHASAQAAFRRANINRTEVDLFEVHDAFSIMACLLLEAVGYADRGLGWRLAAEDKIKLNGRVPVATMGGLKARGHPIGATALYQTCEIVLQLTGRAGKNQVKNARIAMLQSVGGAASTVLTHLFGV
jgi:acetyl-CoA C-acetyltransferase